MRLIAHLIRADIRRSWPLLWAWVLLVAISAAVPTLVPALANGNTRVLTMLELPVALIALAYPLLLLVLVSHVVHTHPMVGTTAFWMTRPIASRDLLLTKGVLLGIVAVIVPAIAEIVCMTAYGVPAPTQAGIAVETMLLHALLLALLICGAAVTANLTRFVLVLGSALVSVAAFFVVVALMQFRQDAPPNYLGWSEPYNPTVTLFEAALLLAVFVAATATQYVTRSLLRTALVGAVGIGIAFVAPDLWPSSLWRPINEPPAWTRDTTALQLHLNESAMTAFASVGVQGTEWVGVRGPIELTNIQSGYLAQVGVTDASLQIGSTTLPSYRELAPARVQVSGQVTHPMFVVQRDVLDVERIPGASRARAEMPTLFFVDQAEFEKYASATGRYHARLRIALERQDIEAVVPLTTGAVHQRGGFRVSIDAIETRMGSVSLQVHESRAASVFDRMPSVYYHYYLRNRARREAVPGTWRAVGMASGAFSLIGVHATMQGSGYGFDVRELLMRFFAQDAMADPSDAMAIDANWLEGAELVILRTMRAGSVERELDIHDFQLTRPQHASSMR